MQKINSLAALSALENVDWHRPFETISHKNENTANNRLFVWNFEASDIEEFIRIFSIFKSETPSDETKRDLNGKLLRKMNTLLIEGYNPVECMLYASKVINTMLLHDIELQTILAERIKEIYIRQIVETTSVFNNILDMWTWIPQLKVVIISIGLIGDNEDLLDCIYNKFSEDESLRTNVFHAFLRNKSVANLERAMKMIMGLRDTEADNMIGRIFKKEITSFGTAASKIINKYYGNPGVSYAGAKIIKRIRLDINDGKIDSEDKQYRQNLATKSRINDAVFKTFMDDCRDKNDDTALYFCRFSRIDAAVYIKERLESGELTQRGKNMAIISIASLGKDGYSPASEVLSRFEDDEESKYAILIGKIILSDEKSAFELADILAKNYDYELKELFDTMNNASMSNPRNEHGLIRKSLLEKFVNLIKGQNDIELEIFSSNLQIFWSKKLFNLISDELLAEIRIALNMYVHGELPLPENVGISLIEIIVNKYDDIVQNILFDLYNNAPSSKIKELSYKKLKNRQISAPK